MTAYLLLFLLVLGLNMMPAFGPPTWTIVVLYGLNTDMPLWLLVPTAAAGAACGRLLLAYGFRWLRNHIPVKWKKNAEAAGEALQRRKRNMIVGLGLFALSPLPSAQLFEAAGLAGLRLLPFTAAFFAGRLVSYSLYGAGAKGMKSTSLGDAFRDGLTSPIGIALQVAMLAALVLLMKVDWAKRLGGGKGKAAR
jgi:membrane protein YqaA with SNARE-associated domain